jgi:hypothetical protein
MTPPKSPALLFRYMLPVPVLEHHPPPSPRLTTYMHSDADECVYIWMVVVLPPGLPCWMRA